MPQFLKWIYFLPQLPGPWKSPKAGLRVFGTASFCLIKALLLDPEWEKKEDD